MRSNKGITLTVLVIYVLVIVFVTGLVSAMTGYFYKNSDEIIAKNSSREQYTKFISFLVKDANRNDLTSCELGGENGNSIIFNFNNMSHQYVYQNEKIYFVNPDQDNLKKIILCSNVSLDESPAFQYQQDQLVINIIVDGEKFANRFIVKTGN